MVFLSDVDAGDTDDGDDEGGGADDDGDEVMIMMVGAILLPGIAHQRYESYLTNGHFPSTD